jgi:cytochrome c oxidase cbb3-type subunit 4
MVDMELIRELQGYGSLVFSFLLVVGLYSYIYHLYKSERTGTRNYEKYSDLVLHDNIDDSLLEEKDTKKEEKDKGSDK